jgi:hypothetical protein
MFRRIVAVLVPSAVLILLILLLPPLELGYLAFLAVAAALMIAAAGAFLVQADPEEPDDPETHGWLVILGIFAVVSTALFWYRVWQYDAWEVVTIPVRLLYIVGFWWPGILLAALAWIIAGTQVYRSVGRYKVVLLVGLVAATVGAASYQATYSTYFKVHDGQRLDLVMQRMQSTVPGKMAWQYRRGVLSIIVDCDWAAEAPPYTVFAALKRVARDALRPLARADVTEVNLRASTNGLLLFVGDSTDVLPSEPMDWVRNMDRSNLKNGGLLDRGSLEDMAQIAPDDFASPAEQEAFQGQFSFSASDTDVTVSFDPGAPLSPANVNQYAVAYRLANRIVTETAAYFPEIQSFKVGLGDRTWTVTKQQAQEKSFCLQADMLPADSLLGMVIRSLDSDAGTLSPATFNKQEPLKQNQMALVVASKGATQDAAGRLLEAVHTPSARVIVTEVAPDGTATVYVLPTDGGSPAGPVSVASNKEELAGNLWIANSGLIPRESFGTPASTNKT